MDLVKEINDFYYHMALYELQVMNGNDYYNGLSYNSLFVHQCDGTDGGVHSQQDGRCAEDHKIRRDPEDQ